MKYMGYLYKTMSDEQLRKLRSRKFVEHQKIVSKSQGYWYMKEANKLHWQMVWIDAELAARAAQMALPE